MEKTKGYRIFNILTVLVLLTGLVFTSHTPVKAATTLTIEPITWNVIGLDSNNVNVGPNTFPVGARVCYTGDEPAYLKADFIWDDSDSYINLSANNTDPLTINGPFTEPCVDFYFEVEVTRNSAAYDHTRAYHIEVTDGTTTVSTPQPRELYVEHLVSQSRNGQLDLRLSTDGVNFSSVAVGGTMGLVVGSTYWIQLVGYTATQGYEQIESYLTLPNTIFQVHEVESVFSSPVNPTIIDQLYGDACFWDSDTASPTYLSCLSSGKMGGDVSITYKLTILGGAGTSRSVNAMIYDFSGSSFHYNADYSADARIISIIDPTNPPLTFTKAFSPDPIAAGGVSTLTFTLTNTSATVLANLNFTDTFPTTPGQMLLATPDNFSAVGCGSPTYSPAGDKKSIALSNITLAASGTCTIKVNVTAPVAGTYTNSTTLKIAAVTTNKTATDTLTAGTYTAPACVPNLLMAEWNFNTTSATPATPPPSTNNVGTAAASVSLAGGVFSYETTNHSAPYSWGIYPFPLNKSTSAYFQFAIAKGSFEDISFSFWVSKKSNNGPTSMDVNWSSQADFSTSTSLATNLSIADKVWTQHTLPTISPAPAVTYFRVYVYGSKNSTGADNIIYVDDVRFTGCGMPLATLSKAFSPATVTPVAPGNTSTLTFTLANPTAVALTNVNFSDVLPTGLTVTSSGTPTPICGGTLTTTAPDRIAFSGGTLAAGATCSIPVTVTATTAGTFTNVSGFISATYGGSTFTNTTSTGFGTATLKAVAPPSMTKSFEPNPIAAGGISTLTFVITNPNLADAMTAVSFTDTFPASMVVADPLTYATSGCGLPNYGPTVGAGSIAFSGGSIAAGGTCTVSVNVTAPTAGSYANTSSTVTGTVAGSALTGNAASSTLTVNTVTPGIAILKQISSTSEYGPWYSYVSVGVSDSVWYKFTVENTGDVDLTNVSVTDASLTALGVDLSDCSWLVLAKYTTTACAVGPVTVVSGTVTNTATASGWYGTTKVEDTDDATYATTGLMLEKSVAETFFSLGTVLHYSYTVSNIGETSFPDPITVEDNKISGVSCPSVSTVGNVNAYLDPGESLVCTATYTVTAADVTAGAITNLAYASAGTTRSNMDIATITGKQSDFGNLPAAYTNLYIDNGPRHLYGTSFLGETVLTDTDGINAFTIVDDDDGIEFLGTWGTYGGSANAIVECPSGTCTLAGWIDWNEDGDFLDTGERIVLANNVTTGTHTYAFTIPAGTNVVDATLYARFRLYAAAPDTVSPTGEARTLGVATVGEVEDYRIVLSGGTPTAIILPEGPACVVDSAIHVTWATINEMDILMFRLYRSVGLTGARSLVHETPALFTGKLLGTEYAYTDTNFTTNTLYYYWLEVVSVEGFSTMMEPAMANLLSFKILLPVIQN